MLETLQDHALHCSRVFTVVDRKERIKDTLSFEPNLHSVLLVVNVDPIHGCA